MPKPSSISWIDSASCASVNMPPIKVSQLRLRDINKRHRQFWPRVTKSTQKWIAIPVIFRHAWASFELERAKSTVNCLNSLESHLIRSYEESSDLFEIAVQSKTAPDFRRVVSSKGGSAKKADPLHELIMTIVRENPAITQRQTLIKLRRYEGGDVIVALDRVTGGLDFLDEYGDKHYVANIKDRLSRIKCKIDSR